MLTGLLSVLALLVSVVVVAVVVACTGLAGELDRDDGGRR